MIEEAVINTWHMVPPRRRQTNHTLLPPHTSSLSTVSTGGKPRQGYIMCSTGPQKRAGRHTFATCHKSIHVANFASTSSSQRLPRVPQTAALARVTGALHRAFNAYEVQSIPDLINFYHRTCCNIPVSTWIQAINQNYFATWPGLTADRVLKYCTAKPEKKRPWAT